MKTFIVTGYTNIGTKEVACIRATAKFESRETAKELIEGLPKSYKVYLSEVLMMDNSKVTFVSCTIYLTQDGVNKGMNETGIKRMKAFLKKVPYEFVEDNIQNPATIEQMKSILG